MPILVPDDLEWMSTDDIKSEWGDRTWDDDVEARVATWLTRAISRAQTVAPCFLNPKQLPAHVQEAAKGIIVNAVLRITDDTKPNTQYQTAGPFSNSTDTKLRSDRILSLADRDELRQLCRTTRGRKRGGSIRTRVGY